LIKHISFSLISFAYNEEELLEKTILEWHNTLRSLGCDFEIVLINDGSVDSSAEIANSLAARLPQLRVFHFERNRGIGHALREALKHVSKDIVFWNDIDGHFDLGDLRKVIPFLEDPEIDIAVGFKHDNWQTKKSLDWLKSRVNYWLIRVLFLSNIRDFQFIQFYPRAILCQGMSIESCSSFIPAECLIKSSALGLTLRQIQLNYHSGNGIQRSGKASGFTAVKTAIQDIFSFWYRWTFAGGKQTAIEHWKKTFGENVTWQQ
jgi:glycosyltransferase involved in cell wall biosynthesis